MSEALPTPPTALVQIVKAAGDPEVSVSALSQMLQAEPSLTAALLAMANSAVYVGDEAVTTVKKAIVTLGLRAVRNVAVAHAVRLITAEADAGDLDGVQFWEDSLRRGSLALILAQTAGYEDGVEAFTLGLIQDLGTLAIAVEHREQSSKIQRSIAFPAPERMEVERQISGQTHVEYLVAKGREWGLPEDMLRVIGLTHSDKPVLADRRLQRLREICMVADAVADVVQTNANPAAISLANQRLDSVTTREPLVMETLLDGASAKMAQMSDEFQIRIGRQPSFRQLMENANEALIQINLSYEELTRRLRQALEEKEQLTRQLRASNAALMRLAATDMLTGVANRRAFTESLNTVLSEAASLPASLVMLDIDHFKKINDTWGHAAGDEVLKAVCERMQGVVRSEDVLGRLGGEEFAVLLPNCPQIEAKRVAERLRLAFKKRAVKTSEGVDIKLTASFGGVTLETAEDVCADDLLKAADTALYAAKARGRDRVVWS